MVVALHDDELVRLDLLVGDVPGLARAAQTNPFALADGVEGEPDVLPYGLPFGRPDRSRFLRQVAVQKLPERPLTDEADAGRVLLRVIRQPGFPRKAAY